MERATPHEPARLAKFYGVQYTTPPAAVLLAYLATHLPAPLDCHTLPISYNNEALRVVDFACGAGALLSAMSKELLTAQQHSEPDEEPPHRSLQVGGLWGFDVQSGPVRITADILAHQNSGVGKIPSHLFSLPLRVAEDAVNLGSLDLLAASTIDTATPIDKPPIRLEVPTFHIAIMNPPFTRSVGGNLQFGDFSPEARRALQGRLRRLLHGLGLTGIGQAGLSAAFIALADLYLATEGCLAMVLPKTLLSGVAWQKIRTLLIGKYHIEAVIASFEGPDAWNFSENTSLSEILLVAQKRALTTLDAPRTYTIFANLWRKPRTEQEARHLGSQLLNLRSHATHHQLDDIDVPLFPLILSGKQVGEAYTLHLTEPTFGFYQLFAQGQLNRTTTLLRTDALHLPGASAIHKLPLAPLASFVSGIGPDVRQIHDTFRRSFQEHESQTDRLRQSYPALWNHKTKQIRTISQQPNAILTSRKPEAATRLWQKGSASLLVVERAWLATVRVLATVTSEPVLSNVWWTLRTKAIKLQDGSHLAPNHVSQFLALWFNSTPGLLLLLSHAEVTRGPWIKIKKRHLRNLSVFDFTILTKPQVATLLKVYQEIEKQPLKPLPREYATPQLRRRLDGIISSILRLDTDWGSLYSKLACDPTLTAQSLCKSIKTG